MGRSVGGERKRDASRRARRVFRSRLVFSGRCVPATGNGAERQPVGRPKASARYDTRRRYVREIRDVPAGRFLPVYRAFSSNTSVDLDNRIYDYRGDVNHRTPRGSDACTDADSRVETRIVRPRRGRGYRRRGPRRGEVSATGVASHHRFSRSSGEWRKQARIKQRGRNGDRNTAEREPETGSRVSVRMVVRVGRQSYLVKIGCDATLPSQGRERGEIIVIVDSCTNIIQSMRAHVSFLSFP